MTLKEKGNEAFKQGDLDEALAYYTQAIDLSDKKKDNEKDLAVIFKNRAAVHLKNEDYEDVVADCTKSIELVWFCFAYIFFVKLCGFPNYLFPFSVGAE